MGEQAAAGSEKTDEESDEIEQAQESEFRWKRGGKRRKSRFRCQPGQQGSAVRITGFTSD